MKTTFITSLLLSLLCNVGFAEAHTKHGNIATQIIEQVNADLPQALLTLEQIVNINSGTMNFSGVKKVGDVLRKELDELAFKTEWIDGSDFNRSGHLLASYGTKGPKILMIGHLDTVFAKTDAFQKFQRLDEHHISGPGITDMKGGDVIIISTLRTLKKLDLLNQVRIKVIMTGDEERSGRPLSASKKVLIDAAKWADIALGFEDGDGNVKTGVVARRGSVGWTLNVSGKPAHSSQIFREEVGYGAIFETARILNSFREDLSTIELLTFNPGMIIGGTTIDYQEKKSLGEAFGKSNVIAQTAKVTGGIRAASTEQLAMAKKVMHEIATNNLAQTSAQLSFDEGYPPMASTQGNNQLLAIYNRASQDLGYGEVTPVDPRKAGAADISFAANHVSMALDGMGLMGKGGHTKGEVADIRSLAQNIQKASLLIYRLSQTQK
jgi:glutamate carboxypeptidase